MTQLIILAQLRLVRELNPFAPGWVFVAIGVISIGKGYMETLGQPNRFPGEPFSFAGKLQIIGGIVFIAIGLVQGIG